MRREGRFRSGSGRFSTTLSAETVAMDEIQLKGSATLNILGDQ